MLDTETFGKELKEHGYSFFSGVPCSFLKDFINYAITNCKYIGAANEGDAVAAASGAMAAGAKSVVLMQNSGLTNAVSPLMSLNFPFQIPVLGFVSLRGEAELNDEPQHELTGKRTTELLDLMDIQWEFLSEEQSEACIQLKNADRYIEKNKPFFFVVKKGTFGKYPLAESKRQKPGNTSDPVFPSSRHSHVQLPTRYAALETISKLKDSSTVQLATTGKTGRELYEIEDAPNNFYMVGSMGCISSFALGLATVQEDKDIFVIDGDGSLLMRMGNLAVNGYYQPANMLHLLLDNGVHDSTGGQATVSSGVDFAAAATACGYGTAKRISGISELEAAIKEWKRVKGLTFLHVKIAPGSKENLGRPKIKPHEVKERLAAFLEQ
ncbi:phosphonopyruvate decarboxylase [Evansella sp. LMS18]|jgi:phosphonopyruvate decarboxylase|uniref:phosphonopyruvate decarboxylase n=1 Tax=Evansella sp. LMS18 TaxID=2924033 RepID=UPI0020D1B420|nr:phosphonopyruvate decarboxylase [Evansella sp. LMS18]UTR11500.1 phosphonopyruvate decarboxylase [Evansella sp. LMS18]